MRGFARSGADLSIEQIRGNMDIALLRVSHCRLARERRDHAKYIDPEEAEGEHYEVYGQLLKRLQEIRSEI